MMLPKHFEVDDEELIIDWLMYRSYEYNRDRSPEIEPSRWRAIYFYADLYEKIYQDKQHDRS